MNQKALLVVIGSLAFVVGAGGMLWFLRESREAAPKTTTGEPVLESLGEGHGKRVVLGENPLICSTHNIPEAMCPFCDPSLIEQLGYCRGHDVAEALCTRCNGTLIAAFKAEGDWCAEHGLPESQCAKCAGSDA